MTDREDQPVYTTGPGHRCSRGPVPEAYAELGAIERHCPTCGSPPNEWCMNKISGTASRVPCGKRNQPGPEAV